MIKSNKNNLMGANKDFTANANSAAYWACKDHLFSSKSQSDNLLNIAQSNKL